MRILFVCNEYPPIVHGGIGSFTKLIAENLILNNHDAIVIGYGERSNEYIEEINKVQVIRLKKRNKSDFRFINYINIFIERFIFYLKICKYISLFKPEIVETYDWSAPLIFKPKGCVLVTRLHGSNTASNISTNIKKSRILYLLERKAIKQSDFIVSVSNYIASITKKAFNLNFNYTTIYNGVDTKKFVNLGITRDNDEILLVGRMHPYKGFDDLFKAMNFIFSNHSTVKFTIICTVIPTFKKRLMSYVNKEYESRINFIGRIQNNQLIYHYNRANLSILPSRTEALPIIPLESMACGTPVIMAERFSSREILDDGVDGFLIDTLDPRELATNICNILKNQNIIEQMRIRCREKVVDMFSIDKVVTTNIEFYQSIL